MIHQKETIYHKKIIIKTKANPILIHSKEINNFIFYSIYSIRKFGSLVQPEKETDAVLKFEFHIKQIKCLMQINQFYIMKILFDTQEDILPVVSGDKPKFNFDKIYYKNMKFEDFENKYMEIIIYNLPSNFDLYSGGSLKSIIEKAGIFASLKIDFLTLVVGPEFHNIVLKSLNKKHETVGRIMYTVICKQLAEIKVTINQVKIKINELLHNNIALKLKYEEKGNKQEEQDKLYSSELIPNLNQKEKRTEYNYVSRPGEKNPLIINTKSSMIDFTSNDSYLNIYSIRLIKKNSNDNKGFIFENNPELKNNININNNLVNHYTKIGFSLLSFLEILSEKGEAMNKQASQFFRHMSGFNKNIDSLNKTKTIETSYLKIFKIQIFQDISRNYITPLYFEGNEIGSCQIDISIKDLPSIRQIMCGVLTENGFEINSIHLYDNILLSKGEITLPEEITDLMKIKHNLDTELLNAKENNNITGLLKDIKKKLSEEIEDGCLYYGYSKKTDLFKGQNIMLDIGNSLFNIVEKVDKGNRKIIFDILKLINERGEFDLGTLSISWFEEKKSSENINLEDKKYEFKNDMILSDKILENFYEFNYRCLSYSLEKLSKGKIIENEVKEFALYYINIAYFRIPSFRIKLLEIISRNVDEKFEQIIDRKIKGKREIKQEKKSIEDLLETDPINNLLLWENLFYAKLKSSLEENDKNKKIENEVNQKRKKIFKLIEESKTWEVPFLNRGIYFFGFLEKLMKYIIIKAKSTTDIIWLNIPGFIPILNAITHEILIRPTNSYNEQFKKFFRLFIDSPEIPNTFIKVIIYKTNVYDVTGIFNIMDIISYLFEEFTEKNPEKKFDKFNYNLLNIIIQPILNVDHSLCVSKIILFYYKYSHLIPILYLSSVSQSFLEKKFYDLFFHWSFEVRDKFFYLILFIFDFKLKDLIPFQDIEDLKIKNREYVGLNFNKRFSDILNNKMKIVKEFQLIIQKENKDCNYNNKINEIKYKDLLEKIPKDVQKNIVVSLDHYERVYKDFIQFVRDNKNKKINDIEFPKLFLIPPKDDYIEYEK